MTYVLPVIILYKCGSQGKRRLAEGVRFVRDNGGDEGQTPVGVPDLASEHGDMDYGRALAGYQNFIGYVEGCLVLNNYFTKLLILQHIRVK